MNCETTEKKFEKYQNIAEKLAKLNGNPVALYLLGALDSDKPNELQNVAKEISGESPETVRATARNWRPAPVGRLLDEAANGERRATNGAEAPTARPATDSGDWIETAKRLPPEGVPLVGMDASGDVYPFQYRELAEGVPLYLGGDLNPVNDPVYWRAQEANA